MTRLAAKQLIPRHLGQGTAGGGRAPSAQTRMAQRRARGLRGGAAAPGGASPVRGGLPGRSAARGRLRRDRHGGSRSLGSGCPLLGELLFRARLLLQPGRKVCLRTVTGHATRFLMVVEPPVACAGGARSPHVFGDAATQRSSGPGGRARAASAAAPSALAQPQVGVCAERR